MELSEKGKTVSDLLAHIDHRLSLFSQNSAESGDDFIGFRNEGKSRDRVLEEIDNRLIDDFTYSSGRILGAMTTEPHEFAKFVYARYIEKNLGDPGLVPGTYLIEQEVVSMLGNLLNCPTARGNQVSGGTESNIIAMRLARKLSSQIKTPEIVLPESAHYSFEKAADIMGLTLRKAELNDDFTVNMTHYESLINENTIALVGVAGTSSLGLIDPIKEIGQLAREHNLYFHVDGAFGGLVLPFLESLGHSYPPFDFRVKEVSSYTVDPHKNLGVIPSGVILVRDPALTELGYSIPYLAGGAVKSLTITGTRPGASAISFWALMQYFGKEGFKSMVQQCWELTLYCKSLLETVPEIELATDPLVNIIGIKLSTQSNFNIEQLDTKLRKRGWALGLFKKYGLLRIVLLPHIQQEHIDAFIQDLKEIFAEN
jgi:tyrosine decarboxylase / aspartate 1-decarboxylase